MCSNAGGRRTKLAQGRHNRAASKDALLDVLKQLELDRQPRRRRREGLLELGLQERPAGGKPAPEGAEARGGGPRTGTFTPEEFLTLLRNTDALFRQVLLFFRLTGIRPGEFCRLTWPQVDLDNHILVIRRHKSRRTGKQKKPRVIHLPAVAEAIIRRRHVDGAEEHVFRNSDGLPGTVNALRCRVRRHRVKAGIVPGENREQVVTDTARHTFGSRAAAAGVSDRRLADLLGHTDPKMTQKYIHLANPDLRGAVLEATRGYLGDGQSSK